MMNKHFYFILLTAPFVLAACTGIKAQGPVLKNPAPKVAQAKEKAKQKKPSFQAPQTLGGAVSSDSWIVYPEKEQEEFKGNVYYDNGVYTFRSDYALSDRKNSTFSASGHVYIKQAPPQGPVYEAQADNGWYNYATSKGELKANKNQFVRLKYTDTDRVTTHAQARRADFNVNAQTYNLYKNVTIRRPTEYGLATVTADKLSVRQADEYALLEGNTKVTTPNHTFTAQTMEFDGKNNRSYAYGSRVLGQGKMEEGTFAIIADRAELENESRKISFKGKVAGWIVSDQINKAEVNEKF